MKIKKIFAIFMAKLAMKISTSIFKKQGVTWAGKIASKICPDILSDLALQVKEHIFVVCGTNGKTTTNNILCAALEDEGKKVVCNRTGSNMLNGIVSAFVLASDWKGKLDADCATIEIDEASTLLVFKYLFPDYMILTNLFRDQLDRYGEIDITINILKKAINMVPDMKIIVNCDDALSTYLAMNTGNKYITYGITEKVTKENIQEIREGKFCKKCGNPLNYEFYHYSQLGIYSCSYCDFKRPKPDIEGSGVQLKDSLEFVAEGRKFSTHYKGFYNVHNILAAYAGIRSIGLNATHFQNTLNSFNPQNGRMEGFYISNTNIILNLAKNPAGFNQNISVIMQDNDIKDIIIVINDNAQDGIDISWLWDVDFDRLKHPSIKKIIVSGLRYQDMGLRLKYVNIQAKLIKNVEAAILETVKHGCGKLYLLVNYTALFTTRKILKKLEQKN